MASFSSYRHHTITANAMRIPAAVAIMMISVSLGIFSTSFAP